MIIGQADPAFDKSDATRTPLRDPLTLAETDGQPDGFQSFLDALRTLVIAFNEPVAFVQATRTTSASTGSVPGQSGASSRKFHTS